MYFTAMAVSRATALLTDPKFADSTTFSMKIISYELTFPLKTYDH